MKRITTAIIGITVLLLAGCSWQVPETVTLKTSPDFEVPGGSRVVDVLDLLDFDSILAGLESEETGISVADTNPGEPIALNLTKELIDISLDNFAGETLDPTQVNQAIDVSYTIPAIDLGGTTINTNIDPIDLPGDVSIPSIPLGTLPEPDGLPVDPLSIAQTVSGTGYSSITFDSGSLVGTVTLTDASPTLSVTVSSVDIEPIGGGTPIVSATNFSGPATDGAPATFEFLLGGETLPSSFDVVFTVSVSGGDSSDFSLGASFAFVGPPTLSAADGIDIAQTISDTHVIPIDPALEFTSATIGVGSLDLSTALSPGFTGINTAVTVTLMQGATTVAGPHDLSGGPLSLNGVTIANADIDVAYDVDVTGTNASFTLDPFADEVTNSVVATIDSFSSITIPNSAVDTTAVTVDPIAIPQDVIDFVTAATFVNPVLTVTLNNQLPGGLDIDLGLTTTTTPAGRFDLVPSAGTSFPAGSETTNTWQLSSPTVTMDFPDIAVTPTITVAGGADPIAVTNVVPGQSYSLTGTVAATLEISSLDIAAYTLPLSTLPDPASPIDLSAIRDVLPASIELTDITASLDLGPDDFTGTLSLFLNARYDTDGDTIREEFPLIGSGTSASPTMADFTDLSTDVPLTDTGQPVDMATIINDAPADLLFDYQVGVTNTTIVNDPNSDTRFGAVLRGRVNFALNATVDTELTDPDTGDPIIPRMEEDILGRTGGEEDGEIEELLAFAEKVTLDYDLVNNLGVRIKAVMVEPADSFNGLDVFEKELVLEDGANTIDLTQADIQRIMNDSDFRPQIHLYILQGNHVLLDGGTVTISASLKLETDIEYTFDLTDQEGE